MEISSRRHPPPKSPELIPTDDGLLSASSNIIPTILTPSKIDPNSKKLVKIAVALGEDPSATDGPPTHTAPTGDAPTGTPPVGDSNVTIGVAVAENLLSTCGLAPPADDSLCQQLRKTR
ncbi:hypothetical protein Adt_11422 [Abeliophyllum distichum]|uniref:Uncharacterized protein n=1 Tax=Abeliophyllum distichum TaxID=126358 RepID=A0ABD1UPI7_9LAMI